MTHLRLPYVARLSSIGKPEPCSNLTTPPQTPAPSRLPGLPGSSEFMTAYQAALDGPRLEIGTSRSKPGSIATAVSASCGSTPVHDAGHNGPARSRHRTHAPGDPTAPARPIWGPSDRPNAAEVHCVDARQDEAARGAQLVQGDPPRYCKFAVAMGNNSRADPTQGIPPPRVVKSRRPPHLERGGDRAVNEAAYPIGTQAPARAGARALHRGSDDQGRDQDGAPACARRAC